MHGTYNIKILFCVLQYQQDTTTHTHSTSRQYKYHNNQAVAITITVHKWKYCTYSCSSLVSPWNTLLSISLMRFLYKYLPDRQQNAISRSRSNKRHAQVMTSEQLTECQNICTVYGETLLPH